MTRLFDFPEAEASPARSTRGDGEPDEAGMLGRRFELLEFGERDAG